MNDLRGLCSRTREGAADGSLGKFVLDVHDRGVGACNHDEQTHQGDGPVGNREHHRFAAGIPCFLPEEEVVE